MQIHPERLSEFRLLVHPTAAGGERRCDASELHALAVGHGVRRLDLETFASNPQLASASRSRGLSTRALCFESLSVEKRAVLIMLTPPGVKVRLNDHPSPIVAVLDVGDQLQIGDTVLHLTKFREFAVGPPSPDLLGRRCGVCRVPCITVECLAPRGACPLTVTSSA